MPVHISYISSLYAGHMSGSYRTNKELFAKTAATHETYKVTFCSQERDGIPATCGKTHWCRRERHIDS